MTMQEAGKLQVGDRVMWGTDAKDLGTVKQTGYRSVTVHWDNGQLGTVALVDARSINRAAQ